MEYRQQITRQELEPISEGRSAVTPDELRTAGFLDPRRALSFCEELVGAAVEVWAPDLRERRSRPGAPGRDPLRTKPTPASYVD